MLLNVEVEVWVLVVPLLAVQACAIFSVPLTYSLTCKFPVMGPAAHHTDSLRVTGVDAARAHWDKRMCCSWTQTYWKQEKSASCLWGGRAEAICDSILRCRSGCLAQRLRCLLGCPRPASEYLGPVPGGSRWWLRYIGLYHTRRRSGWVAGFSLAVVGIWGVN